MKDSITIAICTHNRYDLLDKAISSALKQRLRSKILVIDNSPDVSAAIHHAEKYTLINNLRYEHETTVGLSNARNRAVALCDTQYLAFMDDDACADPNWTKALVSAFTEFGPQTAVVGGCVFPQWDIPRPSWLHDDLLVSLSLVNWGGTTRIATPDEWFAGTNIAFRLEALRNAPPFSTELGRKGKDTLLSNEEIGLVKALRSAGWQMIFQPKAVVHHFIPRERLTRQWFRQRYAWQAVSDAIMSPEQLEKSKETDFQRISHVAARDLFRDTDDAKEFRDQILSLHFLVRAGLTRAPSA